MEIRLVKSRDNTRDKNIGSGSESGVGDMAAAGNFRGGGAAGSVVESTSDGGFLAAGFPGHAAAAPPPAYPAHC